MQSPGGRLALQEPGFRFVSKPKISEVLDGLCYSALSLGFVWFRLGKHFKLLVAIDDGNTINRRAGRHSEPEEYHSCP